MDDIAREGHTSRTQTLLWSCSVLTVLIHLAATGLGGYGLFRDELYYLACANHPGAGYVDHPPLSIWLLSAWRSLFGDSLFVIRAFPALCGGLTTLLVGRLARGFGGGRYAVLLACVVSMLSPIFLGFFGTFSMNAIDLVLWGCVFLLLQRIALERGPADWPFIGLVIGLGALNKVSMLWLACGIALGIILTSLRVVLRTRGPWIAVLFAALLFSPFVIWNMLHGYAHLEFIRNASVDKYASQNLRTFVTGLALFMNPLAIPLWVAGFWLLLARKEFRMIGIAVVTVLAVLLANGHSKAEYFAAAMTVLVPAGAVQLERMLESRAYMWIRPVYLAIVALGGLLITPMAIDILPVATFVRYQAALGLTPKSNEGLAIATLPQHYADRFGWEEMAAAVIRAYESLPDSEKRNCLPYGRNYGEASAIDYFGRRNALPPAVSPHNSYWFWSAERISQDATFLVLGRKGNRLLGEFTDVREAGSIHSLYAMPYESGLSVFVCRKLRRPAAEFWSDMKNFM